MYSLKLSNNSTKHPETSEMNLQIEEIPPELKNWMTNISRELQDIPIWELNIPGSHDSGTYGLDIKQGLSPDGPDIMSSCFIKIIGFLALPVIYRWIKTQSLDITNQMKAGIRYIDIRTTTKPDDKSLYFCHGLYGPKIDDILKQINGFLLENPFEVVFLDFQHFYDLTDQDHKKLIQQIVDLFGSRLVPYSLNSIGELTLRSLWERKQQVFVYYRDDRAQQSPLLWPTQSLPNPWANTLRTKDLLKFLNENMSVRPPNTMYVTQGILTPTETYIVLHFYSSLESNLVQICNKSMTQWLDDKTVGIKGPNIVITDFIEWNNYEIPLKTIKLNDKLFTHY